MPPTTGQNPPPKPYTHKAYPAWRYHATAEAKIVKSAEEDNSLPPGWVDSPAKTKAEPAPAPTSAPSVAPEPSDEQKQAELYESPLKAVLGRIVRINDVALLEKVAAWEKQNPKPKGGRKPVLGAIEARIAILNDDPDKD